MLKGQASAVYYRTIWNQNLSFDKMIALTRATFETETSKQEYIMLWKGTTLRTIISDNNDKPKIECLDLLAEQLKKIQPGLPPLYQNDESIWS